MRPFHSHIRDSLQERLIKLEKELGSDVIFFYGPIYPGVVKVFRDFLEKLKAESPEQPIISVILNTDGGVAETVEKLVDILRFHYEKVHFVVPDYAMSAGTIFCMSGNKIFMDYSSSLGPIDPQVFNGQHYVPALGYLDQVNKMIEKSEKGTLTDAEFLILQQQDLGLLSQCEQAQKLTITLLKKWLAEHKFSDWQMHRTNPDRKGERVTSKDKEERAEEIAAMLSDNQRWHSHGRRIGIDTIKNELRLEIDDYSNNETLRSLIRDYNDFLVEFVERENLPFFLHSRNYF